MSQVKKTWYAVYTKPRWEKKVYGLLMRKRFEVYCPLNKVRKTWTDRIKWVEEPLFKSYVFVKLAENELGHVRTVNGVVNFVYWLGKPAVIKDKEIEVIKRFLNDHDEVQVLKDELHINDRITIQNGILMDKEAKVIKVLNNKVQVVIESLGCRLVALLRKSNITIVERTSIN